MKKTALLLLLSLGLSSVLTAGSRTSSSYVKATAGSNGVQWTGGNYVSSEPSTVRFLSRSSVRSKATAGSNGVQWTGGNYVSNEPSTD